MKIVVFGATGKTGLHFINLALEQGHEITAFVRNPNKINLNNDRLKIVEGSPINILEVKEAIHGNDFVVSCLGGNENKKSTILTDMIMTIVDAMKSKGIKRIVHISSAGIHNEIPGLIPNLFISLLYKNAINDHKGAANYIIKNNLEYTIARPLSLIDSDIRNEYRMAMEGIPKRGRNISRLDLAAFLLESIENEEYINKSVGLSY